MRKRLQSPAFAVLVLVIAVCIGLFAYWQLNVSKSSNSGPSDEDLVDVNLRLKWIMYAGWAGELLADDRGYWEEEGLNVTMAPGGFELDPIKLVASGSDDIGVAGADQILLAREKGVPLVAFAVQYQSSPVGFASMKGSGIDSIEDFRGQDIGVKFGTDVEPIYRTLLSRHGLSAQDVTEVPVKFDLSPFYEGVIDVYPGYLTSDLLLPEEQGFEINTISAVANGVDVYGNVYFTTESFLAENRTVVESFLRGVTRGWNEALASDPRELALLALSYNDALNIDHEARVAAAVGPFVRPEGTAFGSMDADQWEALAEILRQEGVLRASTESSEAFDLSVFESALGN